MDPTRSWGPGPEIRQNWTMAPDAERVVQQP